MLASSIISYGPHLVKIGLAVSGDVSLPVRPESTEAYSVLVKISLAIIIAVIEFGQPT